MDSTVSIIVAVSTAILNIGLIIGFIVKTAKDKVNMENNIHTNAKDISELKGHYKEQFIQLNEGISKTNDLLVGIKETLAVSLEKINNHGKRLDSHSQELDYIKEQIRAN